MGVGGPLGPLVGFDFPGPGGGAFGPGGGDFFPGRGRAGAGPGPGQNPTFSAPGAENPPGAAFGGAPGALRAPGRGTL